MSEGDYDETFPERMYIVFPMVKLLDYLPRWAELEADPNPFAIVVMAHLKAQQLQQPQERREWKVRLVRMLCQRGYDRATSG